MSKVQMERIFTGVLLHFFDSPMEPHQQGYLLSRSMADLLVRCFGLRIFLLRYLESFLDAVIEPARLSTKGSGGWRTIFWLKESKSIFFCHFFAIVTCTYISHYPLFKLSIVYSFPSHFTLLPSLTNLSLLPLVGLQDLWIEIWLYVVVCRTL